MAKLVECIPNFSLSKEKNEAGYNALIEVAKSVPGCIHCFLGGRIKNRILFVCHGSRRTWTL